MSSMFFLRSSAAFTKPFDILLLRSKASWTRFSDSLILLFIIGESDMKRVVILEEPWWWINNIDNENLFKIIIRYHGNTNECEAMKLDNFNTMEYRSENDYPATQ